MELHLYLQLTYNLNKVAVKQIELSMRLCPRGRREEIMSSAEAHIDTALQPDEVWQIIGGFGSLPDWFPEVSQTELADGGRIRHLHDSSGHAFVERLETYDHAAHRYSYSIVESPISVTNYLATLAVTPRSIHSGSHIEWSCTYTPVKMSEEEAENVFCTIFSAGLKALATHLKLRSPT
jgi:hypothetical protein